MGRSRSKNESLLDQVGYGNLDDITTLVREGADLECTDCSGMTPLMKACNTQDLHPAAKLLIQLGADLNAISPCPKGGSPLHFAASRDLVQTIELLLSHGANAHATNDCHQTPLDIARSKGFTNTVRKIEDNVCLFSGWLQELYGLPRSGASKFLSKKVWVVVLPLSFGISQRPLELELAIYTDIQDSQPCTVVPLNRAHLGEPNLNQPDPVVIISDIPRIPPYWREWRRIKPNQEATGAQLKFAPLHENEKHQLQRFSDACKGIYQVRNPSFGSNASVPSAPLAALKDEESPQGFNPMKPFAVDAATSENIAPKILEGSYGCTICCNAPVEGTFVPCGHMVGCLLCMEKIKKTKSECSICRKSIDQVIRLYPVV